MRSKRSLLFAVLIALILFQFTGCDDSSSGPGDPNGVIPSENLKAARKFAIKESNGRAIVIWHDGDILLEHYKGAFNGQKLHRLWSCSKSFSGLMTAIAVKNGLLTFDTTLGELIPEWDPESERGKITIRQLLSLTSGIETAFPGNSQTAEEWLTADLVHERGSTFAYGPTPFYILSWIFVETLDIDPIEYLTANLFSPLGVVTGEWSAVDEKYPNLAFGGNYPASDLLQVGILLKNHGMMDGKQIIDGDLLDQLLTPSEANPGYGITFWLNTPVGQQKRSEMDIPGLSKSQVTEKMISDVMPDDLFMMAGAFGQKLYICPSLNLVIVRFGDLLIGDMDDEGFFSRLMDGVDQSAL